MLAITCSEGTPAPYEPEPIPIDFKVEPYLVQTPLYHMPRLDCPTVSAETVFTMPSPNTEGEFDRK